MRTIGNWQAAKCRVGYYCSSHGQRLTESLTDRSIHSRFIAPIFLYAGLLDSSHRDSSVGGRIGFSSGGGALVYPYPYLRVRSTVVVLYSPNRKARTMMPSRRGFLAPTIRVRVNSLHGRACLGIEASRHPPILQTSRSGHCSS